MKKPRHFLSEARYVVASRLLLPISGFLLLIVIGRTSNQLLGEYALVTTVYFVMQALPLMGLEPFVVREAARDHGRVATLLVGVGGLAISAALAIGALWWSVRERVAYPASTVAALDVVAVGIVWGIVAFLCEAMLVALHEARVVARIALIENLGRLVASLLVLQFAPELRNLFLVFFAGRAAALVAMAITLHRHPSRPVRWADLRALISQIRPLLPTFLGATMLALLASRLDYLVLSANADLVVLGHYAISYRYLEIAAMLVQALITAMYPRLARIHLDDLDRYRAVVRSLIEMAMVGLPMLAVAALLFADSYVDWLFPRQFPAPVFLTQCFAALIALAGFDNLLAALLRSCDRQGDDLRAQTVGTLVLVAALFALVPSLLGPGAFLAAVLAVATQAAWRLALLRQRLALHVPRAAVARVALLSLAMLVATAQICDEMPRWAQLAAIPFLPLLFLLLAALMGGVHPGAWLRALAHPLRVGERSVGARLGDTLRRMAEDLRAQDRLLRRPPRDRNPRLVGHGTLALMLYRISHWALANSQLRLAGFLWRLNTTLTGADIHPVASIGPGCLIVHPVGVVIFGRLGRGVTLYARVLVDCVDLPQQLDRAPTIGDRAELGALSAVLGPVRIADDARIVPGSLIEQPAGLAVRRSRSTA